jgi:hypothetical protein
MTEKKIIIQTWPRLMDVPTAAAYIGMAEKTMRNRISRKSKNPLPIKVKRAGRTVLLDKRDLDRYADTL